MAKRQREDADANCDLSAAKVVGETKWLRLETLSWTDRKGVERGWDRCVRTTKANEGAPDGVLVITTLKGEQTDQIVLVKQFRPPINAFTLEFPAGLCDPGENSEEAAVRELKEECGYVGVATGKSFPLPLSPGFTNESVTAVNVEVDMTLPENKNPAQQLEDDESCEVVKLEKGKLLAELQRYAGEGVQIACDLHCFAQGLALAQGS